MNVPYLRPLFAPNTYAYDAYFLECARKLRSPLLTLDQQMKVIARKIGIQGAMGTPMKLCVSVE